MLNMFLYFEDMLQAEYETGHYTQWQTQTSRQVISNTTLLNISFFFSLT